jgi:ATP-dependent Lon protease
VELYERLLKSFTLKDYLIYGNEDVYKKYLMIYADAALIKNTNLENIIRKFTSMDTFAQRNMLINLLCVNNNDEVKYITYLLYDVITATNGNAGEVVDSREQSLIYDSFPWAVKIQFKDIMKFTIKYTQDMMQKYDINRVSLEQQIYVMKVPEYIKEKAMVKLKEIKGKGDESSTKAKQYLEGLLKIPFGIYKKEPLLCAIKTINEEFKIILNQCDEYCANLQIPKKAQYANIEIISYMDRINICVRDKLGNYIYNTLKIQKNKQLLSILKYLRDLFTRENIDYVFRYGKKPENIAQIADVLQKHPQYKYDIFDMIQGSTVSKIKMSASSITASIKNIDVDLKRVHDVLDASIHGHDYAKNQILKIIGQWMNGEQTGYCFGFEGSPGVGKTSVAKKGLANCLVDADGASRPFAFIALGGSCNGSTLEGHSYTYVNSMWGRIVDILMETKCMNPIIYVDELDKVSKTEHGKEIIGILTHLIDTTQNDCFQDKYYSGINIDLSKALFIFSYNDPENIDRILLDRIHRIRFDNLTLENKMVIVKDYLLPEINEKMGFCDVVVIEEGVIEYLIETFTMEPGVRKLKEVIFDLYGEINLDLLKCNDEQKVEIPFVVKIEDLETKYLKKYHKIQETKIPEKSGIGIINGLWANALGKGGIIPIETMLYPCSGFLELKLTGLQGDVMKESMNVAKSLAWGLTPLARKKELIAEFEETKCQGLHIHCPQGAVSKDGPSAGTAITVAIYSLFNKRIISNTVAITGEINLQGKVTAIGGLDSKILGGIRAGVKRFLYPKENHREYVEFMEKYGGKSCVDGIEFIEVSTIEDVFPYVYDTF